MNIHIALYKWKPTATSEQIDQALKDTEALVKKIPGILDITTGENTSNYSEGYTHVILVRGKDQAAIDAYRNHPDHVTVAAIIESMEDQGIGVDLKIDNNTQRSSIIKGVSFLGVQTDKLEEMRALFHDAFGLEAKHERPGFTAFVTPDGDRIELFAPNYPEHEHFTTGPVGGFEVDDIEKGMELLKSQGLELLTDIRGREGGTRWIHFRGPDGNVYELVNHAKG